MDYLNRHSYKPLYLQLSENLRQRIEGDDLEPGSRLPSENELVARYGVSRNTARQAINALIAQGLVYRLQGRGTAGGEAIGGECLDGIERESVPHHVLRGQILRKLLP